LRAYWELNAEQVVNRLFAPEPSIDLEIIESRPAPLPASAPPGQGPSLEPEIKSWNQRLALATGLGRRHQPKAMLEASREPRRQPPYPTW